MKSDMNGEELIAVGFIILIVFKFYKNGRGLMER